MNEPAIGFVGGGRITRIMLGGWKKANKLPAQVVVSDHDSGVLERLERDFPGIAATADNTRAARQGVVFFALHPPAFPAVLEEIKDSLSPSGVLVSLAPKWTMSRMGQLLGGFGRLARVIPNAPSIVNRGYNPLCFSEQLPHVQRSQVKGLLAPLGACPDVAESSLEAYALVAAMGPTYLWFQLYELIELGYRFGLTREAAVEAVSAMVDGTIGTMSGAGLSPEQVMDLIPVKPLASMESAVKDAYGTLLPELHRKLTS